MCLPIYRLALASRHHATHADRHPGFLLSHENQNPHIERALTSPGPPHAFFSPQDQHVQGTAWYRAPPPSQVPLGSARPGGAQGGRRPAFGGGGRAQLDAIGRAAAPGDGPARVVAARGVGRHRGVQQRDQREGGSAQRR